MTNQSQCFLNPAHNVPPGFACVRRSARSTAVKGLVRGLSLHTVCEEALCPNIGECWGAGTATTDDARRHVHARVSLLCYQGRKPAWSRRHCRAGRGRCDCRVKLNYVVITSVDPGDLPDGGADILPNSAPDRSKISQDARRDSHAHFRGVLENVRTVVESRPDVFGQNIETVRRLTNVVRDWRASYD